MIWRNLLGKALLLLMTFMAVQTPVLAQEAENADLRVLIDISGSMLKNDPKNLRRPALRMLVGLMQPGTRAGTWTFARWVNMLVKHGDVDAEWKQQALALSNEIASPGQFTNIEEALYRATRDWEGGDSRYRRHIVLLTDGMVDISKKPGENASSRERILNALLPRIKNNGARIHAIALSERADHELLRRLAAETDGWYQQINEAEELQKVFLRIFEKAGRPDTVPLNGNRFQLDGSIREATILVFNAASGKQPRLITPSGAVIDGDKAVTGVNWHRDTGYTLITVANPEPGEWQLDADVDPDNRVMVVTDLKLNVSELPNRLVVGEEVSLMASLASDGKTITRQDFLDLLEVAVKRRTPDTESTLPINDQGDAGDSQAKDGYFGVAFADQFPADEVELLVQAKSPTFVREKRHVLSVVEAAELTLQSGAEGDVALMTVEMAALQSDGLAVTLWQEDLSGARQSLVLEQKGDGHWQAPLLLIDGSPVYASVEGKTRAGNVLDRVYGPVYPEGVVPPVAEPPPQEPVSPPQQEVLSEEKTNDPEPSAPLEQEPAEQPDPEEDWVVSVAAFGGFNLLLIGGGLLFWWRRRAKQGMDEFNLEADMPSVPGNPEPADDADEEPERGTEQGDDGR